MTHQDFATRHFIRLKDQTGTQVALFDNWAGLEYVKEVNGVGSYSLTLIGGDARRSLFELDGQVEVWRSIPAMGIDWYLDFEGFHRKIIKSISENGEKTFTSVGVGYNDLLARSVIAYKAGTIRADKEAPSETVMKEYVRENCGPTTDWTIVGRLFDGGFPNFSVEPNTNGGIVWSGTRAYENLLDVLQDIAAYSSIDFAVEGLPEAHFIFRTFLTQMGADRTVAGLSATTGLNQFGNSPVIFSDLHGNVANLTYTKDHTSERNVIIVLGPGEGSTRQTVTRFRPSEIDDSPWNRLEASRPVQVPDSALPDTVTYNMQVFGDEMLEELKAKEQIEFDPLPQESTLYGVNYALGDRVTAQYDGLSINKKIIKATTRVQEDREQVSLEFTDMPLVK